MLNLGTVHCQSRQEDETAEIIARFRAADDRIRVQDHPRTLSFVEVLEVGRRSARSQFLARMDADDLMHRDRLLNDLRMLESHPDAAVVTSQVELFPRERIQEGMNLYVKWQNNVLSPEDHDREIWIEQTVCNPAATFRTSALEAIGGYRAGPFPEDYDLFVRLHVSGHRFIKRGEIGHYWRRHQSSFSVQSTNFSHDAFAGVKAEGLFQKFDLGKKPVCILGSGRHGGRMAKLLLERGVRIDAFFDVSPIRIGKTRHGITIRKQQDLAAYKAEVPNAFRHWGRWRPRASQGRSGAVGRSGFSRT